MLVCCDLLVNVPLDGFGLVFVFLFEGISFLVQEGLQLFRGPRIVIPKRSNPFVDGHIHKNVDVAHHSSCTVNRAV